MLRHSFEVPCRREGPPSIWDTHGISGNVFANPTASSSEPYPQELNQWNSSEEPLYSSTVEKGGRRTQYQDQRCQSGPSAKNSVIFSGGKEFWSRATTTADFRSSFWQIPYASHACWKTRFKTEACTCSQFSCGSDALDQRSGDGWFSGWSKIFVLCKRNLNAKFWSARCEDHFNTEQNHP